MERCLAAMENAKDPEDWLTANNRFHEILYQRSGRRRTIQMINQARLATNRYTRIHHTMAFETLGTEHRLIYEAAEAGHARRLEALTLAHLSQGFETMLRYVAQQEEDFPTREEQGVDRD